MIPLRPPAMVMRLARLGAMHQSRLSFMRVLLRQLRRERWRFERPVWEINAAGVGRAVYLAHGPRRSYALVAFAHDLPDAMRSDRVIAEAWDATFTLFDGVPTREDLDRLAAQVPKQEAGRITDRELVLSRANRSVRLWDKVIGTLAAGHQPDPAEIDAVGYLMRTTAVYGSGKFGAADHAALAGRGLMSGPFRAEMLTVWLIRSFSLDLVEHLAAGRGGARAVPLAPDLRRRFGIGNSTGLGMAPFLVNHPALLDAWITARETALARVRSLPTLGPGTEADFRRALTRAMAETAAWQSTDREQAAKCAALSRDLAALQRRLDNGALAGTLPWDALYRWGEGALSLEGQEMLVSLMIEPHGPLVDPLADRMGVDEMAHFQIDARRSVGDTRATLEAGYAWALAADPGTSEDQARFWYVSAAKLEPRLGERATEPGAERELPLDIARQARAYHRALAAWPGEAPLAAMLARHPEHRRIARRVQIAAKAPYAEIHDNLIGADLCAVDMLRCKLSFFGATRFDPRSDRWLRIAMYQGAPFPGDLAALPEDDWIYPAPVRVEPMPVP